jgi:hypothetical protein
VTIAREILAGHGVDYLLNTSTATIDETRILLKQVGFKKIEIIKEDDGHHVPWEKAKESWISINDFAPGQYPHPVSNVSPEIMANCKKQYLARIEELNTEKGVWNDTSML